MAATYRVVIFLANEGYEPTEASSPWRVLTSSGCSVVFATEEGGIGVGDERLLQKGLFGSVLGVSPAGVKEYEAMKASLEYKSPLSWSDPSFNILSYDIAILPGGHDKPIRQYLESQSLHRHISKFLPYTKRGPKNSSAPKVLGAICHGPLVLAFGKNDETGESLIHGLESATLPKWLEMTAWVVSQAWALGNYYRTYGTRNWCEEQIQKAGAVFRRGPMNMGPFVHVDPNYRYISARFPGDCELWSRTLLEEAKNAQENP